MAKPLLLLLFLVTSTISCQTTGGTGSAMPSPLPHSTDEPIWDVTAGVMIDMGTLLQALQQSEYILLGELHDNPWHHEGQAAILQALFAGDQRPAVAFEMFRVDQQPLIDEHFNEHPGDVTGLSETLRWEETGWPDWSYYAPLVEAAYDADVPVVAANLSAETLARMRDDGMQALDMAWRARTGLDEPLPRGGDQELAELIETAHCGYAPASLVETMIDMQRARDAKLADRMLEADSEGAVLIAGNQHARQDRGVPFYLRYMEPEARIISIGFMETDDDENGMIVEPELLSSDMPYDYLWFTPRVERDDPCEQFRRHMEKRSPPPGVETEQVPVE